MRRPTETLIMLLVIMGSYIAFLALMVARLLQPAARKLLFALTGIAVFLLLMFMATAGDKTFWGWFFHPTSEMAGGAVFSSTQHIVVALIALFIGLFGSWQARWPRVYWVIMAGLFVFLGLDEYFVLHETVLLWRYMYPLAGAAAVGLTVLAWWFAFRRDWYVAALVVVGLGIMGFGGVALDAFSNEQVLSFGSYEANWFVCDAYFLEVPCQHYGFAEEFLETVGGSLILSTLFSFLLVKTQPERQRRLVQFLAVGVGVWLLWTASNLLFIPTLENLILPNDRFAVTFEDDSIQFLGYRASPAVAAPGDTVDVTLYFRANRPIREDYYVSVHALSRPDAVSVAQADTKLGMWDYPTYAWIPGFAVRNSLQLTLPADLPDDPSSYAITARLWTTEMDKPDLQEDELEGLPITESARELLTEDTVIMYGQAVMTAQDTPAPPQAADYDFDGGFSLVGYDLPESATLGEPLPLRFWWQTGPRPDISLNLVQFIHLFHSNGQDYFVFDRQPFGDRFPTADWPGSVTLMDSFSLPLPDDLPPGEYTVRSGMYEPINKDRIVVRDAGGEVVTDFSTTLGTITVQEP